MDLVRALRHPDAGGSADAISRRPAPAIGPDALLSDAARLMDEHNVEHLVVVDRERPVGILSALDVAGAVAWGRR